MNSIVTLYPLRKNHFKLLRNIIILLNVLNISNYTFLTYNISGQPVNNLLFEVLIYARLPLSMLPALIVVIFSNRVPPGLGFFQRKNSDFTILALYLVITSFFSTDFGTSILYSLWFIFSGYSILILLFFLSYNFNIRDYIKQYSRIIVFSYAIILIFVGPSLPLVYSQGPESVYFTSKTNYAYCLVATVAGLLIYLMSSSQKNIKHDLFIYALVLICLIGLMGSGKRTAFLITNIIVILYLSFRFARIGLLLLITIPIFYTTYQGYFSGLLEKYQTQSYTLERLSKIEYGEEANIEDSSYESRLMLWGYYLDIWEDYPLLGIGRNNRASVVDNYKKISYLKDLSYHNTFLHFLVEFGAIGMVLIGLIIIRGVHIMWTKDKTRFRMFFIMFLPTLAVNWFETSALPGQIFFWYTFFVWLYPRIYLSPYFRISKMDKTFRVAQLKYENTEPSLVASQSTLNKGF